VLGIIKDAPSISRIGATEGPRLDANSIRRIEGERAESSIAILASVAKESRETVARDQQAAIAQLQAQALRYQAALDNISQGVCFFDGEGRLILCNRRFAEIYRLDLDQTPVGASLGEIIERRVAAGACPMSAEDYLAHCARINSGLAPSIWIAALPDGRRIQVNHQHMPDGGWVSTHEDVTELHDKRAIADERISLQILIDQVPDYLWIKDSESRFVVVNKALASDHGRVRTSDMIGLTDADIHAADVARDFREIEQEILSCGEPMLDREEWITDAAGARKCLSSSKVPLRNEKGDIFGLVGIARDITERKRADALRDGQARILEMIATSAPVDKVLERLMHLIESQLSGIYGSILLLEEDGLHLRHGAAPSLAEAYTGAIDGARIGPNVGSCGTAVYRREPVMVADIMADPLWADFKDLAAQDGLRSCWSTPIFSHQGAVLGTFAMYSKTVREPTPGETKLIDVGTRIAGIAIERQQSEERIRFLANHDVLTGLPNRTLLHERLSQAILYAQRYDRRVTVLFIDLDNFKFANDSLGHNAGDELLKVVARRMVDCVGDTGAVVRFGGDEFVILLLDQPKNADAVSATVRKIMRAIAEPVPVVGHDLRVTSSIGIANYPGDGTDPGTLLANADAAMYRAKEIGRDNFQFYVPVMNTRIHEKFLLQEELRDAIARREFVLHYQPLVDLRTRRVFAVEALIRWNHPAMGQISPAKFIPLAEESGLIAPIGDWALHEACRQNKAWQDAGLPAVTMCVNVSAREFSEGGWIARVVDALQESRLDAKYLELELTESLIMQDVDRAVATMKDLRGLGVQLSIDDFGAGYSSLSALKTFPVARLKIDRSFISDLPDDEHAKAVASAVISLGQKLNMRVIAEGVETDYQVAFLRQRNCDEMQGFHFSKPLTAKEIEVFLAALETEMGSTSRSEAIVATPTTED
jgi:diguanylate cyclase (GGDEF)-like protein/PAS domain S-box-containing protein